MTCFSKDKIIEIIKSEYPNSNNKILAKKLNISKSTLRTKASKLKVRKSKEYMDKVYKKMHKGRQIKQENSYKDYKINNIERNIIIGSLIGDGTLSLYGRSKNACYRENTGSKQTKYRKWKSRNLRNLDFKTDKNGAISSPSHLH